MRAGPLPFQSLEEDPQLDQRLLKVLQGGKALPDAKRVSAASFKKLRVHTATKVTQGGIVSPHPLCC